MYYRMFRFCTLFFALFTLSCQNDTRLYQKERIVRLSPGSVPSVMQDQNKNDFRKTDAFSGDFLKKEENIALLLPMTGAKKAIGNQVFDAIVMAIKDTNGTNIKLFIFDTEGTASGALDAVKKAVSIKPSFVVGPIFKNELESVIPILKTNNINTISLSNDKSLASEKIYTFGIHPDAMYSSIVSFLSENNNKNISIIAEGNKEGMMFFDNFKKVAEKNDVKILSHQYYSAQNSKSFEKVAQDIKRSKYVSFRVDEKGNEYQINLNDKNRQNNKDKVTMIEMNALYINASGQDLFSIISELRKKSVFGSDMITVVDHSIVDDETVLINPMSDGLIFAHHVNSSSKNFITEFKKTYGYRPLRIASLGYDAIGTVVTVLNKNVDILNQEGFAGVTGEFLFTKKGLVKRKYNIAMIKKGSIDMIDKTNDFK